MKRLTFALAFAAVLVAPGAPALAQAPSTMSYQGVLTDALGNLAPDGAYTLTFRVYDVSVAGAPLWTEAHPGVLLQRGGFSVILGEITPLALPFDRQYWLGVQVFADPELVPRVKLASSPYAASLRLPFSQAISSASPLLNLYNSGAGPAITADPELNVGNVESGNLRIFRAGIGSPFVQGSTQANGGQVRLFDEAGALTFQLEPDNSNLSGGFFSVYRTSGSAAGFTVDINANEPDVTISGSARSAAFDMGLAGNSSVSLPTDAISASETLDEPGVAYAADDVGVTLDGTVQTLISRTITVPAAGYLVAVGCFQLNVTHVNGTRDALQYGLSTVAGSLPTRQDFFYDVPSVYPTTSHFPTPSCTAIFPVAAGATTVYLIGQEISGSLGINDIALSVMYFPTAYGTVAAAGPQTISGGSDELVGSARSSLSASDIASEQAEARTFNEARLARELGEMRAQLDAMERKLAASAASQVAPADRRK